MYRSDKIKKELQESWTGYFPGEIALAFLDYLEALIANEPQYFANGHGNSLAHTLQMAANTVAEASKEAA